MKAIFAQLPETIRPIDHRIHVAIPIRCKYLDMFVAIVVENRICLRVQEMIFIRVAIISAYLPWIHTTYFDKAPVKSRCNCANCAADRSLLCQLILRSSKASRGSGGKRQV